MFQWIICARRPLHVEELREGIAFTIDDQFFDREKLPTNMLKLIRGCGNLVVVDKDTQHVHLAHYTVQQYILLKREVSSDPCQTYRFTYGEANNAIGETCVTYLSFSDFKRQVSKAINKNMAEMAVLQKAASSRTTTNIGLLGSTMHQALTLVHRHSDSSTTESLKIDYHHVIRRCPPPSKVLSESYRLLRYTADNWLSHIAAFNIVSDTGRRENMLRALVIEKQLPFTFRPWDVGETTGNLDHLCLLGWALEHDYVPVVRAIPDSPWSAVKIIQQACDAGMKGSDACTTKARIYVGPVAEQLLWLYTKLVLACRQGSRTILQYCLKYDIRNLRIDPVNPDNGISFAINHLLCEAAAYGQLEIVEWIIAESEICQFVNPDFTCKHLIDEYGNCCSNAMTIALFRGHSRIAVMLQAKEFHALGLFKGLSRHMGNVLKNDLAVDTILDVVKPHTIDQEQTLHHLHYDALSEAARRGDEGRMKRLIQVFNLEDPVRDGQKPLLSAITDNNPALVRLLVNAGAYTVVLFRVLQDNVKSITMNTAMVDVILEAVKPATVEQAGMLDCMSISQAIQRDDRARVKRLISSLQDVFDPDMGCLTPLNSAVSENKLALTRVLINAGAYLNEPWDLEPAIWFALRNNNLDMLRLLSELGADLTTRKSGSLSILEYATQNYLKEIFFFLTQRFGPDCEIPFSDHYFQQARREWCLRADDRRDIVNFKIRRDELKRKCKSAPDESLGHDCR
jgi:hypothetical protein